MKRGDYVTQNLPPHPVAYSRPIGLVRRVSRHGAWADVWWRGRIDGTPKRWAKRMSLYMLTVLHEDEVVFSKEDDTEYYSVMNINKRKT